MMRTDRVFGTVVVLVALAYIAGAFQIEEGFMPDPLGSRAVPILIGIVGALCGAVMIALPDAEPNWPGLATLGALALAVVVMVGYAYALVPFGFLVPTAVASAVLSYQIDPKPGAAVLTGLGLSVGLFFVFRYALGLGLQPFPEGVFG